jgi:hypothetical protein
VRRETVERFLEFLFVGIVMGTIEDLLAVRLVTGEAIDPRTIYIVIAVSIPFAAISELVVDHEETAYFKGLANKIHSKI